VGIGSAQLSPAAARAAACRRLSAVACRLRARTRPHKSTSPPPKKTLPSTRKRRLPPPLRLAKAPLEPPPPPQPPAHPLVMWCRTTTPTGSARPSATRRSAAGVSLRSFLWRWLRAPLGWLCVLRSLGHASRARCCKQHLVHSQPNQYPRP